MTATSKAFDRPIALRARWLIPVDRPPIDGGIVTVAAGQIIAVGENASSQPPRDLGDVALLPGLVNTHTHLEFSLLKQPLGQPGISFAEWIRDLVARRRTSRELLGSDRAAMDRYQLKSLRHGIAESLNSGIAAIGDICTPAWPPDAMPAAGIQATVFLELLSLAADRAEPLLAIARQFVADWREKAVNNLRPGLSPHAPYTVSPALLSGACELSKAARLPLAMHLAESREELELLQSHTGSLVDLLLSLNAWHPDASPLGLRPLDYLRTLATAHRTLVIHGNYLVDDEIGFLAAHCDRMSVIYCPRTHAYFGHEPYPLATMLAAGVRVAVGTDSRASNPDLNLFEELRHIARNHPAVSPDVVLRMGTLSGAESLGLADQFGSITAGKSARLAIVPLAGRAASPYESLFTSAPGSSRPLALSAA